MFCGKCGAEVPDEYTFCTKCGVPIPGASPPPEHGVRVPTSSGPVHGRSNSTSLSSEKYIGIGLMALGLAITGSLLLAIAATESENATSGAETLGLVFITMVGLWLILFSVGAGLVALATYLIRSR